MCQIDIYKYDDIINMILDEVDGVYIIDTEVDRYKKVKSSSNFEGIFGDSGSYTEMIKILLFHTNCDAEIVDEYQNFIPNLKHFNGKYGRLVKIIRNDLILWTQMNIYPLEQKSQYAMVLNVLDNCELMEEQMAKEKSAVMQGAYLFSMYVNLLEDKCSCVNVTEMDHGSQKYTDLKYSEWRKIIVHTIHQDHQEVFLLRSEPDYIISHLQDRTSTSFECQMKDLQGVYRWVRLIFSRVPSVEDDASRFVYMVQDIHDDSLRLIKDMKKYEKMSIHDSLTGLFNRRKMETELEEFITPCGVKKDTILFMIDIDHFKNVNDTYGHAAGDRVLIKVACILQTNLSRHGMITGRWGGEEFVSVGSGISSTDAYFIAEEIRKLIAEASFDEVGSITCSFGVIKVEEDEDVEGAFERVDKALYMAKANGRDCVVFS